MTVYFTKILSLAIYPLTWVLLLLIFALFAIMIERSRLAFLGLLLGLSGLWAMATPMTGQWLMYQLEKQHPAQDVQTYPQADVIILLGGGLKGSAPPHRPLPEMENAADRIWLAAELYHAQKAPHIIASGGTLSWLGSQQSEAQAMHQLLNRMGVPTYAVIEEDQSLTTVENAHYCQQLFKDKEPKRILLVTSAGHMPRAMTIFKDQFPNATITAASADIRVTKLDVPSDWLDWLPQASALETFNPAWHEYVGYVVYSLKKELKRLL